MTTAAFARHQPAVARDRQRLMKQPDREWLRVIGAFAILGGVMAALTLGQLGIAALLRWLVGT